MRYGDLGEDEDGAPANDLGAMAIATAFRKADKESLKLK